MKMKHAFLTVCSAFAVLVGTVSPAAAADKGQVVVAAWGGTYQDALRATIFKPFEKATGIKVVEAVGPAMPKLQTMINSGNPEWDVAEILPQDYLQLANEGKLQKIDYSAMDRSVFADFTKDAVQPFGVGWIGYSKVIAFNTKKYTRADGPKNWVDVWDVKKFPGPRILDAGNYVIPPIEYVLLGDGVPREKLYPLDLKRAYGAMSRIKPDVVKWATTAAMEAETIISGDAVIGPAQQGRVQLAKEQGAPIDYVWNEALFENDYWAILKGAKNVNNAQKFIEFASRAENQAALAKLFIVGPMNKKAYELIPPERAKDLPTYPENLAKSVKLDKAWWADRNSSGKTNQESNSAMWNDWTLRQE
jgi:putative spermidine/putrescine transport system substrate-binding protein